MPLWVIGVTNVPHRGWGGVLMVGRLGTSGGREHMRTLYFLLSFRFT